MTSHTSGPSEQEQIDWWENSVSIPEYPYRERITMESFRRRLDRADVCWEYASGSAYYEGRKNYDTLKYMASKLGPEAENLFNAKFHPTKLPPAA